MIRKRMLFNIYTYCAYEYRLYITNKLIKKKKHLPFKNQSYIFYDRILFAFPNSFLASYNNEKHKITMIYASITCLGAIAFLNE